MAEQWPFKPLVESSSLSSLTLFFTHQRTLQYADVFLVLHAEARHGPIGLVFIGSAASQPFG
jgi:hypothetical protein